MIAAAVSGIAALLLLVWAGLVTIQIRHGRTSGLFWAFERPVKTKQPQVQPDSIPEPTSVQAA